MRKILVVLAFVFASCAGPGKSLCKVPAPGQTKASNQQEQQLPVLPQNFFMRMFQDMEKANQPLVRPEKLPKNKKWVHTIRLNDQINGQTATAAIDEIKKANEAKVDVVVLEIDSPGGSIAWGMDLARAIEDSEVPVHCVADGTAASMAYAVLQSCKERVMTRRTILMMHEASISAQLSIQPQDAETLRQVLQAITDALYEMYGARMKVSISEIRRRTAGGKEWWLTHRDALRFGAADCVVKTRAGLKKAYENGKTCSAAR